MASSNYYNTVGVEHRDGLLNDPVNLAYRVAKTEPSTRQFLEYR